MIAVMIGGTGLTGGALIRKLLADAVITGVLSVSRRSLPQHDSKLIEALIPDLSALPSIAARMRGDLYFCCLGTTIKAAGSKANFERVDHDAIVDFAKIARGHDAKSFTFISSLGANAESRIFYNQVKGRTERDVRILGLRSLTIFRPALLIGPRSERRVAENIATKMLVPLGRLVPDRTRRRHDRCRHPCGKDARGGQGRGRRDSCHRGQRYLGMLAVHRGQGRSILSRRPASDAAISCNS